MKKIAYSYKYRCVVEVTGVPYLGDCGMMVYRCFVPKHTVPVEIPVYDLEGLTEISA